MCFLKTLACTVNGKWTPSALQHKSEYTFIHWLQRLLYKVRPAHQHR